MDDLLEFAVNCAYESGRIQRKYYGKRFEIHHKGEINLVTDVDFECQNRIIELIKASFPDDEVIAEEKTNYYGGTKNRWIVDPLDGTTNYAHGYPFFCTSIAYEEEGMITLGVVYNPIFKELFFTRKGGGAYLNGNKIRVSGTYDLKKSLVSTGFPYDLATNPNNNVDHFTRFLFEAQAIRRDGSAALNLSYLACGRFDGFWELNLNPWDVAAGALMVLEADGMITTFSGGEYNIYSGEILASNGLIHQKMSHVLGRNL
ncbi:MAG: inositol monophosphatase [Syntrophobacterales bacterium]|jgi:myo-inositol-1(or 4)-monophosphatase|nr:inositol monophosphatase [Syntrophobacterales bacterium]